VCLLVLPAITSQRLALLFLTLGFGAVATSAAGFLGNPLDSGPRCAGVLMGITNPVGTIPGMLAPAITGFLSQCTGSWDPVFSLAASISTIGLLIWRLFATGERVVE
jgi:cyanate permease